MPKHHNPSSAHTATPQPLDSGLKSSVVKTCDDLGDEIEKIDDIVAMLTTLRFALEAVAPA